MTPVMGLVGSRATHSHQFGVVNQKRLPQGRYFPCLVRWYRTASKPLLLVGPRHFHLRPSRVLRRLTTGNCLRLYFRRYRSPNYPRER
ncbi:hypothetical protein ANO14919_120220 [Xylariales sp. No.14919]|nr:hypothetical protein ANO14919_120220 [Xylariales sp. No.14919]